MTLDQFAQIRVNEFSEKDNDSTFHQILDKVNDKQLYLDIDSAANARVWEMAHLAYTQGFRDAIAPHEEGIVL